MKTIVAIAALTFSSHAAFAQQPQRVDECPQGRVIRAQKHYPASMTDCQVLDADTAAENQRLRRRQATPQLPPPARPIAAPAPAVAPVVPPAPAAPPAATPAQTAPAQPTAPGLPKDYVDRIIGNWVVGAKFDRFGDGGQFVAITRDGTRALAVRCLEKDLTIAVGDIGLDPKPVTRGETYHFKFRVGSQPVVAAAGLAINDRFVQVETPKSLVRAIRDGEETAVRMENAMGVSSTNLFNTRGARAAFADLSKECPLEE